MPNVAIRRFSNLAVKQKSHSPMPSVARSNSGLSIELVATGSRHSEACRRANLSEVNALKRARRKSIHVRAFRVRDIKQQQSGWGEDALIVFALAERSLQEQHGRAVVRIAAAE